MKGIILLANGFEDVEMIATLDLLRRASIDVSTIGVMNQESILSQSKVIYKCDYLLKDINVDDYDFLIIPGGKAVFNDLDKPIVEQIVNSFVKRNKLIAAICAAPSVLGKMHLLRNHQAVCYPGFEDQLYEAFVSKDRVMVSGNIVTSRGPGCTIEFALQLATILKGEEVAKAVAEGMLVK